ncbi:MAG: VOC family protein [Neomegalonema sp.]|nr:VOC family protein [Neomegalonema sp.]
MYQLDHITVIAPSVAEGVDYVERQLGVVAPVGGRHLQMGTHNHLLKLGDALFLEIIAIDPAAAAPDRPRWFGLDAEGGSALRLATWVIGVADIDGVLADAPDGAGRATPISRGELSWRISIPDDGSLPMEGAFPTVIEWPAGPHPAANLPQSGCRLASLTVRHPRADLIESFLQGKMSEPRLAIEAAAAVEIVAEIDTPAGRRRLE